MRGELVLGGRPCDQAYFSDPIPYRSGVLVTRFVVGPVISLALQGAVANQRARAQPKIGPSRGSEISAHHALPSLQVCLCKQFCKRVLHVSHDITLHGSVGSVLCAGGHRGRGVWCVSCVVVWGSRPPLRLLFSGVTRNFAKKRYDSKNAKRASPMLAHLRHPHRAACTSIALKTRALDRGRRPPHCARAKDSALRED